jgi:hypothetical protein
MHTKLQHLNFIMRIFIGLETFKRNERYALFRFPLKAEIPSHIKQSKAGILSQIKCRNARSFRY